MLIRKGICIRLALLFVVVESTIEALDTIDKYLCVIPYLGMLSSQDFGVNVAVAGMVRALISLPILTCLLFVCLTKEPANIEWVQMQRRGCHEHRRRRSGEQAVCIYLSELTFNI